MTTEPTDPPAVLALRGDLVGALASIDLRLAGIGRRMDRKFARNLTVMALIVVGLAVALLSAYSAHTDLRAANRNTAGARIASCRQYNLQQQTQTEAEIMQSHDLIRALTAAAPASAALEARVKAYNRSHDALIRGEHTPRDCTPAGIARYLGQR